MKTIRMVVMILAILVSGAVSQVKASEDQFNVQVFAIRGVLVTNSGWKTWATMKVGELYTNKTLPDLGSRLMTEYITQPTPRTNQSLWFTVRITGKNGSKLNLNMLRFRETSSDSANSLANSYSLVGANYAYE